MKYCLEKNSNVQSLVHIIGTRFVSDSGVKAAIVLEIKMPVEA